MRQGLARLQVLRASLATLVLVIRLMASLMPMPMDGPAAQRSDALGALLSDAAICHADAPASGTTDRAPSGHPGGHAHDCGICPICHVLTAAALPAALAPDLDPSAYPRERHRTARPPATGPPLIARSASSPRGPPPLSV